MYVYLKVGQYVVNHIYYRRNFWGILFRNCASCCKEEQLLGPYSTFKSTDKVVLVHYRLFSDA